MLDPEPRRSSRDRPSRAGQHEAFRHRATSTRRALGLRHRRWQVRELGVAVTRTDHARRRPQSGTCAPSCRGHPATTIGPRRCGVAWLWPLIDRPHRDSSAVWLDDDLAPELSAGGRLAGLLNAARRRTRHRRRLPAGHHASRHSTRRRRTRRAGHLGDRPDAARRRRRDALAATTVTHAAEADNRQAAAPRREGLARGAARASRQRYERHPAAVRRSRRRRGGAQRPGDTRRCGRRRRAAGCHPAAAARRHTHRDRLAAGRLRRPARASTRCSATAQPASSCPTQRCRRSSRRTRHPLRWHLLSRRHGDIPTALSDSDPVRRRRRGDGADDPDRTPRVVAAALPRRDADDPGRGAVEMRRSILVAPAPALGAVGRATRPICSPTPARCRGSTRRRSAPSSAAARQTPRLARQPLTYPGVARHNELPASYLRRGRAAAASARRNFDATSCRRATPRPGPQHAACSAGAVHQPGENNRVARPTALDNAFSSAVTRR